MSESEQESLLRTWLSTLGIVGSHLVAIAVLAVVLVRAVSRSMQLFDNHEVELPAATVFVLNLSYAFVNYWYLLVLALPVEAAAYFLLRRCGPRINWLAGALLVVPLLMAILLLGLVLMALMIPLSTIFASDVRP